VERLENAKRYSQSLVHAAQRLSDEAAEREADAAEVERLRAEGLPVLSVEEVAEADEVLRIERLITAEGEHLPEEEWPNVPGARVHVVKEWVYPEDEYDDTAEDEATEQDDEKYEPAEPYQQYVPVWVVTDLAASGLRRRGQIGASGTGSTSDDDGESEEQAEARRQERRRVIANNKAWDSAEFSALVKRAGAAQVDRGDNKPASQEAPVPESSPDGANGHACELQRQVLRLSRLGFGLRDGSRLPTSTEPVAIGSQRSRVKPPRMQRLRPASNRPQ
jgi:ParB family chromosome partitioning protein